MKHHYPDCQGGPTCNCDERELEEMQTDSYHFDFTKFADCKRRIELCSDSELNILALDSEEHLRTTKLMMAAAIVAELRERLKRQRVAKEEAGDE